MTTRTVLLLGSCLLIGCPSDGDPEDDAGSLCPGEEVLCAGFCTDVQGDVENCGECNNRCPDQGATTVCNEGACMFTCLAEYSDCDEDPTNACEAHLPSDTQNCRRCGEVCPGRPNAAPACFEDGCGIECREGFGDCNADTEDGCEIDIANDIDHCGSCDFQCTAGPNSVAACVEGNCVLVCDAGRDDCNGDPADGCEIELATDPQNCGACGNVCPTAPNAVPVCDGTCTIRCDTGFGNCNFDDTDGCEIFGVCT